MKSIFNRADYAEIQQRVGGLTPQNSRQWGQMDIAQMMAHCSIGFEQAIGRIRFKDKSNFMLRIIIKHLVLKAVRKGDLGKNQKTFPDFRVTDERNFEIEKKRLQQAIENFYEYGIRGNIGRHPYFGKFSKNDWGTLQYVHINHHLTQFSA